VPKYSIELDEALLYGLTPGAQKYAYGGTVELTVEAAHDYYSVRNQFYAWQERLRRLATTGKNSPEKQKKVI